MGGGRSKTTFFPDAGEAANCHSEVDEQGRAGYWDRYFRLSFAYCRPILAYFGLIKTIFVLLHLILGLVLAYFASARGDAFRNVRGMQTGTVFLMLKLTKKEFAWVPPHANEPENPGRANRKNRYVVATLSTFVRFCLWGG